ncbi:MAG: class I SAM-dependent methyltransferase [Chloroflexi bacterium]|nr:class I SAM-dependent methyltransferase [Chloroflexota bacterium]
MRDVAVPGAVRTAWSRETHGRFVTKYEVEARFCELLEKYLAPRSVVLDAGCGQWGLIGHFGSLTRSVVGIDVNVGTLCRNEVIQSGVVGDLSILPFADEAFDAATCQWVVEHLRDPVRFFREIFRVLKPGGNLFIMTPNLLNYEALAGKLIPNRLHAPLLRELLGRSEEHTFPTYYRSNTPMSLDRNLFSVGLRKLEMCFVDGMPDRWRFSRLLAVLNVVYRRVTDYSALNWGKAYLVCAYRKSSGINRFQGGCL